MKRRTLNFASLFFILVMMFVNSGAASANDSVTLHPTDSKLTETLEEIESLMFIGMLSETDELKEPYADFNKQYVGYFGGANCLDDMINLYTTDTNAPLIKELSSNPNIVIKKVAYSLNKLNQLALDLVALGEAGKINGYGGPPVVNIRENRVDLSLWNEASLPDGLSPDAVIREVNADRIVLHIRYNENYPVVDGVVMQVPKTGDAPNVIGFVLLPLVGAAASLVLFKRICDAFHKTKS